ncbi:Leucine-rich repeat-containing protein 9 [Clydaea vesicula]|uniref:Leucine-rich repeat-containing protein 9 n=1 Tax=Clydaea vesicula TaxID=447962 RepID=A0AAD5TYF3_9FUNG|nr:Leucine-rich repeat-containing protein 9 [Clydaea vesicula]
MEYTEDDLLNTNFSSISEITLEPKILEIARSCHLAQPFMTISSRRIEREIHRVDTQVSELMSELQKYTEIKSNVFPTIAFTMGLLLRKSINTIETLNLSFCQPKVENQEQTKTLNTKLNPTTSFLNDFSTFTNLKHLYISNTDIYNEKMLENLKNFSLLETLDLSFNFLQYLPKSLKYLTKLKVLNLMGNKLDIDMYFDFFPKNSENTKNENNAVEFWFNSLTNLDLRFNLICSRKNYDTIFISKLKNLKLFNGVEIKEENKPVKINYEKLLIERSSCQKYIFRPLSVRTHRGFGSTTSFHEYWDPKSKRMQIYLCDSSPLNQEKYFTTPNADKIRHITTLELDNCNLFDLKLLPDGMVNLRWASFKNNNLREIDKLENFQGLEELCLEGNEIEHLECLIKLPNLARLDASNNRVANIVAAASFKSLVFLSLEGNRIKSLKEFAHNHTLMELYVANNEIKDLFSIFPLKEIQRLIILDLTGNEITKCKDYRLFLIFHLSKLKILDGGSISTKEQQSAKDLLFGRLTVELLGEKIGHFSFKNILELDLRNFKIKEIDCFKPLTFEKKPSSGLDEFRNLKRINFDNNCLTNIDSLTRLRGLKYLSLNGNKIERLLVTDSPGYFNKNIESDTKVTPEYNLSYILFPNLEELYLGNNLISKISDLGLGRIPNLRYLNLNGNKITKLDGLEHLTSLISLVLDKNHIKSAEPSSFLSLVNLRDLHLRENRIKTLCHFDCLPNLQKIFLQGNRIQEISELEKFKLPNLQEISLTGNSVSRRQIFRVTLIMRCPNLLVIDGKDVTEEERLRVEGFLSEQNQLKEDVAKILPPPLLNQSMNSIVKLPIKIKSVVLDGLEMKLSSNNSGFGSSNRMN